MDPIQLYQYIIMPTLDKLEMGGRAACELLLGTALIESDAEYVRQIGGGPALGIYQMEPATHDSLWEHHLRYRPGREATVAAFAGKFLLGPSHMQGNLYYATAMARLRYRIVPAPLPKAGDAEAQAAYWKKHYNTYQPEQTSEYVHGQLARYISGIRAVDFRVIDR